MQRIIIDNLKTNCIIGVKPGERLRPQEITVDVSLSLDLSKAGNTDNLEDTVDYDALAKDIVAFIERSQFNLIEKLAYEVAKYVKKITGAYEAKIVIKKPSAIDHARYAAVEVTL
jgi:FolB domain-containing protein